MADQKINELPTKTAPSTGDKMLMIGTAEEYQIDYDKLATAILNKLSTQSFSSLETTAKTVLGGINELNSKIGGNILSISIVATNQFKIKSMFDSIPTSGVQRQSIFIFGCANGIAVYGMITLFSNSPSNSRWDGVGDIEVDIDSDGIVTVTVPQISYDVFTCISGDSIAQT